MRRRAQVRTQTLVKNAIIQVDATPFKQFYQQHYGMEVGVKKRSAAATAAAAEAKAAEEKPAEGAEVSFPCPPRRRHTHTVPPASPHPFVRPHPISSLPLPHALHYYRRHEAAAAAPASEVASPLLSAAAARAPSGQAAGRAAARASANVEARAQAEKEAGPAKQSQHLKRKLKIRNQTRTLDEARPAAGAAACQALYCCAHGLRRPARCPARRSLPASWSGTGPLQAAWPTGCAAVTVSDCSVRNRAPRRRWARAGRAQALDTQFASGRLYACIASRPGQCGRCDGYILEGKELEFYQRKLLKKKGK